MAILLPYITYFLGPVAKVYLQKCYRSESLQLRPGETLSEETFNKNVAEFFGVRWTNS